jgi:hypothetical protein
MGGRLYLQLQHSIQLVLYTEILPQVFIRLLLFYYNKKNKYIENIIF